MMVFRNAFTLIELLVVISIIVLLLSLLAPALDKAIYQAELARCGAQLKTMTLTLTQYAMDHDRNFPSRPALKPTYLRVKDFNYDLRVPLYEYLSFEGSRSVFNCPLSPAALDYKNTDHAWIEGDYNLFFGYTYWAGSVMSKLTSRPNWDGKTFNLMAGDMEVHSATVAFWNGRPQAESSHPDDLGKMSEWVDTNQFYFSRYWNFNDNTRGRVDLNFARVDGAVNRYNHLKVRDERLTVIPFAPGWNPRDVGTLAPHVSQ